MLLPPDLFSNVTAHPFWSILTVYLAKDKFSPRTICARLDGLEKLRDRVYDFVAKWHLKHCQLKGQLAENRNQFSEHRKKGLSV